MLLMALFESLSSQSYTSPSNIPGLRSVIMLLSKLSLWHCVKLENTPDGIDVISLSWRDKCHKLTGMLLSTSILFPTGYSFLRDTNPVQTSSWTLEMLFPFSHRSTRITRGRNAPDSMTLILLFDSFSSQSDTSPSNIPGFNSAILLLSKFSFRHFVKLEKIPVWMTLISFSWRNMFHTFGGISAGTSVKPWFFPQYALFHPPQSSWQCTPWNSTNTINKETIILFLPPATKLGQGYIFTGVCDSINSGGSGPTGCLLPGRLVWGVPAPRGVCLLPGGVSSGGMPANSGRGVPDGDPPPSRTATAAGGKHPTGMHSCHYKQLHQSCLKLSFLNCVTKLPTLSNTVSY